MIAPHRLSSVALALALALTQHACSGGSAGSMGEFPTESLLALTTESGSLRVEVRTLPDQPPTRGDVTMQLSIRDVQTGVPEVGLGLKVVPWMPAMGHGTSIKPTIFESSPGIYQLDHLILFMPGTWQIRTDFEGSVSEHVVPTLEIR